MIGIVLNLLKFFFWSRTAWVIYLVLVSALVGHTTYCRIYLRFKRKKVGGKRTALITGGSGGIGYSLAKLFIEDEYNIIIVARNEEKLVKAKEELEKIIGTEGQFVISWSYDLSLDESALAIYERLIKEGIQIDVLVNNAGFGIMGTYFLKMPENIITSMIMTNCTSLVKLTKYILPGMIERKYGYILNVSSLAGFTPVAYSSVYCATKSFVRAFSQSIYVELHEHPNVSCTLLSPGATSTDFKDTAFNGMKNEDVGKFLGPVQKSDDCAFEGYRGMLMREVEVVSGLVNFVFSRFMLIQNLLFPIFLTGIGLRMIWLPIVKEKEKRMKGQ